MSTADTHIHDIVGVGIGPFGLGLAALSDPLPDVDAVFVDQREEFRWHPGMMIEGATVQVPFLADLVTMADPTSRFSFLQFLKDSGRLYPFYIRESFYPLRAEFDEYCRWVAAQLDTLRWNRTVASVTRNDDVYTVTAEVADGSGQTLRTETDRARHLVLGVGTEPVLPEALQNLETAQNLETVQNLEVGEDTSVAGPVIHTSKYLDHRDELLESGSITIVGSGQSAAEIYRDLIDEAEARDVRLDWVTRSPRFFPMEYTKLTLEMTSPEYTDHFRALPDDLREQLGREQRTLYKGISADLVDDIHDTLYRLSRGGRKLRTNLLADSELISATPDGGTGDYRLRFRHTALDKCFDRRSGSVVSATGYRSQVPDFLTPLGEEVRLDAKDRLDVSRHYTVNDAGTIHVLNGEEHTHGVTAPDLGFGPWRASVVLSHVTGRVPYPIEKTIAFQTFGVPDDGAFDERADQSAADLTLESHTTEPSDDDCEAHFAFADADDKEMTHV
ncbi:MULTISPECIES: SidA/IucD/PvdA family monooxygenase [Brevibacterium]|uniref:L-lysine N6-monooxygenase MbtG n=2 Tax=Brevibacterium antiquum TaxID=234835 RepID=A0A2H1KV21_9MICO|nr:MULTISPECIES: SidA/IucD/PvdA family monooxygenase [Brevibacterium]SMX89184.1 lysine N6-hydroxylase [Brevibacterium antiquum]SMY03633.1 lysine N6-hydroxylase [Brevibacterium antiquum CNRZ 918]HCG55527.1 L-lysine 6-monooxygenase [Brevibacterium sp.]